MACGNQESPTGDMKMKSIVTKFIKDENGATAIEYGLIAALIAVAIIVGVRALGGKLGTTFNNINSNL